MLRYRRIDDPYRRSRKIASFIWKSIVLVMWAALVAGIYLTVAPLLEQPTAIAVIPSPTSTAVQSRVPTVAFYPTWTPIPTASSTVVPTPAPTQTPIPERACTPAELVDGFKIGPADLYPDPGYVVNPLQYWPEPSAMYLVETTFGDCQAMGVLFKARGAHWQHYLDVYSVDQWGNKSLVARGEQPVNLLPATTFYVQVRFAPRMVGRTVFNADLVVDDYQDQILTVGDLSFVQDDWLFIQDPVMTPTAVVFIQP
jgi:hypothetical protein